MRPRIETSGDEETLKERVEAYANETGLVKYRAYGELIEAGLEAENRGYEPTDVEHLCRVIDDTVEKLEDADDWTVADAREAIRIARQDIDVDIEE